MEKGLKEKIVNWLKTKTENDIDYVKRSKWTIFLKHPQISEYNIKKIVDEPEDKIKEVERSPDEKRLIVIRYFSKKYDTIYIILDPFHKDLETKWKDKVAIVTVYPNRI